MCYDPKGTLKSFGGKLGPSTGIRLSLFDNPFRVIGVSYSSTVSDISTAIEDAELDGVVDETTLQNARAAMVTPKSRLATELAWLPELSDQQIKKVLGLLEKNDTAETLRGIDHLPELAKANVTAHLCGQNIFSLEVVNQMAIYWDDIDQHHLLAFINDNRRRSGFPQVEKTALADALSRMRLTHASVAAEYIWNSKRPGAAMNTVVVSELKRSPHNAFLGSLVSEYDKRSDFELGRLGEFIDADIDAARLPDAKLTALVQSLSQLLDSWDQICQPVQLYEQSRGHEEARSKRIFGKVRNLAIDLANEFGHYEEAQQLSRALLETFPELESAAETLKADLSTLEGLRDQKKQAEKIGPLVDACEKAKADLDTTCRMLRSGGASAIDRGLVPGFVVAFDKARTSADNPWLAYFIVRDLALHLNNEGDDPQAAFELTQWLIERAGTSAPGEVLEQLREDRAVVHKNWKFRELSRQGNNLSGAINTVSDLLKYATGTDRNELQKLHSKLQFRRVGKFVKYAIGAGIVAIIGYTLLLENSRPARRSSSPSTTSTMPSSAPTQQVASYDEELPPVGQGRLLSTAQVRYCVFEGVRLDHLRGLVTTNLDIDKFNSRIESFNARCSNFQYRPGVLQRLETEALTRSSALRSEAQRIMASW